MIDYILVIFFYFGVGAAIACFNCAIHDTPLPTDMSEEDKNMFVLIIAFWAILLPVKFIMRLYKAIMVLLAKKQLVMITEDYCSYEVAKLLKEKGFDEICSYEWGIPDIDKGYVLQKWAIYNGQIKNSELIEDAYAAPTHQMAMAWLREVHNIMISPYALSLGYYFEIFDLTTRDITGCKPLYKVGIPNKEDVLSTYEEAIEASLKYALENLI